MCQIQNSSCEKQICTCTGFHFKCTPYARWALSVECAAFTTALQLVSRVSRQLQLHVRLIITIIASGCNLAWRFSGGGMCPYMYFVLVYHTRGTNSPPAPPPLLNRTHTAFLMPYMHSRWVVKQTGHLALPHALLVSRHASHVVHSKRSLHHYLVYVYTHNDKVIIYSLYHLAHSYWN